MVAAVWITTSSGFSASSLSRSGVTPEACSQILEFLRVESRCSKVPPPRRTFLCEDPQSSMIVGQCCSLKIRTRARFERTTVSSTETTEARAADGWLSAFGPLPLAGLALPLGESASSSRCVSVPCDLAVRIAVNLDA
eukprot:COSAG02_NODE_64_length_43111_cov_35.627709_37_plen_138_part_00